MYVVPHPLSAATLVSAAVRVVLPWSTWPIVPTLTCGLLRSNFALAIRNRPRYSVFGRRSLPITDDRQRLTHNSHQFPELATGIEPVTSSLPRTRSTD